MKTGCEVSVCAVRGQSAFLPSPVQQGSPFSTHLHALWRVVRTTRKLRPINTVIAKIAGVSDAIRVGVDRPAGVRVVISPKNILRCHEAAAEERRRNEALGRAGRTK